MKKAITLIRDPFKVILEHKSEFIIWFLFTIITGQFGILANIIVKYYANNTGLTYSLFVDSVNGSFYTFSIAAVASLLGPIFINFINSKKVEFKTLKTFTIIVSIFYLFITATIYAAIQSNSKVSISNLKFRIDYTQLITYMLSLLLLAYGYCILKLETSGLDFKKLNDPLFNEIDDEKVNETIDAGKGITHDAKGIKL